MRASETQAKVVTLEAVDSEGWGVDAQRFDSTVIRPNEVGKVAIDLPGKCKPKSHKVSEMEPLLATCRGEDVPLIPMVMSLSSEQVPFDLGVEGNKVIITTGLSETSTFVSAVVGNQAGIVANETRNAAQDMNEPTPPDFTESTDGPFINMLEATTASVSVVNVPSGYRYCPTSCTPTALHDYCTWSPDAWGQANFRGPCAIHDMEIDRIRVKAISLASKRNERYGADGRLGDNKRTNCRYYYPRTFVDAVNREACLGVTLGYEGAVRAKTTVWDGR